MKTCHVIAVAFVSFLSVPASAQDLKAPNEDTTSADVIVYGSTPGGFCAAIAAAREGASVILLEPTDHVGAMNTGGLSHCEGKGGTRSNVTFGTGC